MARAPAKKPTTTVTNWEQQMAEQAEVATGALRSGGAGGKFFSVKGGVLSFDNNALPGNQMAVVILGAMIENSYYDTPYDPDTPASPKCFAFAEHEEDLAPPDAVDNDPYFERQHAQCSGCPQNEWGSARTGRGKACSNVMRLVMIPAGVYKSKGGRNAGFELELFDDPDILAKAEPAFMKLSVMNVRNYSAYVKALAADMRRPPWGVITNIEIEPDQKSQFKVVFNAIDALPNEMLNVTMPRHSVEQAVLDFPYSPPMKDEEPTPAKPNNKLARKPVGTAQRKR